MRTALGLWAVLASVTPARAETFPHTDLAGLVLTTDTIVVADRLPTTPGLGKGRYRIAKVLRGPAKVGDVVEVPDAGLVGNHVVDPRTVLYLRTGSLITLDTTVKGKVFCFRQSGPMIDMVPRGDDPDDLWRAGTPQLDLAGLERKVGEAIARVDALEAARKLSDPGARRAAVLALFPRVRMGRSSGPYWDYFGERAKANLVAAGDFEGAVLVAQRLLPKDRDVEAPFAEVAAIAADRKRPVAVRAAATTSISGIALIEDDAHGKQLLALLRDPEPAVRVAAIRAADSTHGMGSTNKEDQDRITRMQVASRGAFKATFPTEQDPTVLYALLDVLRQRSVAAPARTGGVVAVAAATTDERDHLSVEVHCVLPALVQKVTTAQLVLTDATGATRSAMGGIALHCAGTDEQFATKGTPPAPGRYKLELLLSGKSLLPPIRLGTLVVEPDGSRVE